MQRGSGSQALKLAQHAAQGELAGRLPRGAAVGQLGVVVIDDVAQLQAHTHTGGKMGVRAAAAQLQKQEEEECCCFSASPGAGVGAVAAAPHVQRKLDICLQEGADRDL